jgi:hypothetical protein
VKFWLPFQIDTMADAPVAGIDCGAVNQAADEANAASSLAADAAEKAFDWEVKAREAQVRIHAFNQEIAGKFFGKPAGWRKLAGGQYIGFTDLDHEGDLVPHGEGEQWFPSGNYCCGEFHMQHGKGLSYWRFANGMERVGSFDVRKNSGSCVDRTPHGVVSAGDFAPGGLGYTFKLGLIQYPDESQYLGFCDFVREADCWAPSGFGIWTSGTSFSCFGYFEDGSLSGECLLRTPSGNVGGNASQGRLIARGAEIDL